LDPVHPPAAVVAVHPVASVVDQVRTLEPPEPMLVGAAVSVAVGGGYFTVTSM
jgi:hypothetical protein